MRTTLIVLAVALNIWPSLDATDWSPGFAPAARAQATGGVPLFRDGFIDPDSPHPMSHVASLTELPDGRLAAVWYAGSREGASDVALYLSTQGPADARWSPPRAIVTRESVARDLRRYIKKVGNPLVFADSAGKLWLIYVTVSVGGWSGSSLNVTTSLDGGMTWTASRRLTLSPFFNLSELVRNAPAPLADGGWAVPIYHELVSTFPEILWLHETPEGLLATKSRVSAGWFGYQPALTPTEASHALALLRDDSDTRKVSLARTDDAGDTWSQPQTLELPNPDSGLSATKLTDGRLLLAFNDSTDGRENLRLAMSDDEGRTWTRVATLAEEPGADFSYPFLRQAQSGDVHLVYTWKRQRIRHVVFNVAWLDERARARVRSQPLR
jgi:predicted neuraminidase